MAIPADMAALAAQIEAHIKADTYTPQVRFVDFAAPGPSTAAELAANMQAAQSKLREAVDRAARPCVREVYEPTPRHDYTDVYWAMMCGMAKRNTEGAARAHHTPTRKTAIDGEFTVVPKTPKLEHEK